MRLDRGRKQVTLKLADGKTETLPLTDRAASEADDRLSDAGATGVIVYYSDESGHKVVHYLKKMP